MCGQVDVIPRTLHLARTFPPGRSHFPGYRVLEDVRVGELWLLLNGNGVYLNSFVRALTARARLPFPTSGANFQKAGGLGSRRNYS